MFVAFPAKAGDYECRPLPDVVADYEAKGIVIKPLRGGLDTINAYASVLPFQLPSNVDFTEMAIADGNGIVVKALLIETDCVTYSITISRDLHMQAMNMVRGI